GLSVSLSSSTLVVGAPGDAQDPGRVHVFAREPAGWREVEEPLSEPPAGHARFGSRVVVRSGTILGDAGGDLRRNENGTPAYVGALSTWTRQPVLRVAPGASGARGAPREFELMAGSNHAGDRFQMLASLCGTRPGFSGPSLAVPLNPDALLDGILA